MRKIKRNYLLYESDVEYADFCINHVKGCSHGCRYPCYSFMMAKRFGQVKSYNEWTNPALVENSLELLDKEIPKYKNKIKYVHLSFMCDPFMYGYPEVRKMTLKIIEKLNQNNIRCTILTKGMHSKALTNIKKYSEKNSYGITLVSLDNKFKKKMEPNSAPFGKRINALKRLHDAGLNTWVSIEPYPTPNIIDQDLEKILEKVSFVDKIIFGRLNYNVKTSEFGKDKKFYEKSAKNVIDFCKDNELNYHIKYGTRDKNNKKTSNLFL